MGVVDRTFSLGPPPWQQCVIHRNMNYHYVWLVWSSAFLVPWLPLFLASDQHQRQMGWASLLMAPFGLTEPLFVPEYWNPSSLFELAGNIRTTA